MPDCYKIKLRASGFRLVYQVHGKVLVVTVIAVGKRENGLIYLAAKKRLQELTHHGGAAGKAGRLSRAKPGRRGVERS